VSLLFTLPTAFAAGALTILSPCVLPLAPIVIAGGRAADPRGPLALAAGLAATYGVVGGALASAGAEFGDSTFIRVLSGGLMLAIGLALLIGRFGDALEVRLGGLGRIADALRTKLPEVGLLGQAATGVVLAFAWAPCAGPTLGAAFVLAAQGGSLAIAMLTMTVYALGAAASLLIVGYGVGRIFARGGAASAGVGGRRLLGASLAAVGALVLLGLDHVIEAALIGAMPDWLTGFAASL